MKKIHYILIKQRKKHLWKFKQKTTTAIITTITTIITNKNMENLYDILHIYVKSKTDVR